MTDREARDRRDGEKLIRLTRERAQARQDWEDIKQAADTTLRKASARYTRTVDAEVTHMAKIDKRVAEGLA